MQDLTCPVWRTGGAPNVMGPMASTSAARKASRAGGVPPQAAEKWGQALAAGYQILPDALIRGQHLLKLTATDIVVIANLNQAWWFADRLPYLRPVTIARRMGISERSVQRSLKRLRDRGFLRQERQEQVEGFPLYTHDLTGLRDQLERLARRDIEYSERRRSEWSASPSTPAGAEHKTLAVRTGRRGAGSTPAPRGRDEEVPL